MVFNSFHFLLFFSAIFSLYWLVPSRWQWLLLLVSSYYFYMSWNPAYAALILLTTLVSYLTALGIEKYHAKRHLLLALSTVVCMGILFVFKYYNFFIDSWNWLFVSTELSLNFSALDLLLPVGISFYTFQTVSYVIDVYRRRYKAERHFGYYALYVSFFPQLVAGPIERADNLLPQLHKSYTFDYTKAVSGLQLFFLGLFKKIVIADNLALYVDEVFASHEEFRGLSLFLAVFFFSWQIYCDFSGYTDMARGVARMLGIELMKNFDQPYFATSLTDFWRRWHISLSTWFKDYLYIPLGGNRHGLVRTAINLTIVFAVCGLWHGAAITFVLWGLFHGLGVAAERVVGQLVGGRWSWPAWIGVPYTYGLVLLSWVLFRAQDLPQAMYFYSNMFVGLRHFVQPSYIMATLTQVFSSNTLEMAVVGLALAIVFMIEVASQYDFFAKKFIHYPTLVRWGAYVVGIVLLVLLRNAEVKEFIYFQF